MSSNSSSINEDALGGPTSTKTIHVGANRFKVLAACAIDVSSHRGHQITPSQFNQFLIDNFSEVGKQQLLKEADQS